MLALIGSRGGQYENILERVKSEILEDKVFFLGKRTDIGAFLSAMDVFLFPSLYEGLPFALVEAQANGLTCVISDTISREVNVIPGQLKPLSLGTSPEKWAETVVRAGKRPRVGKEEIYQGLVEGHFDICREARRLKKLYGE